MKMTYLVGITGGIGGGKSTVGRYLTEMGGTVIDTDNIARELTLPGSDALDEIREKFGDLVFHDDGSLNRRAMADIVFKDKARLDELNAILHPRVREKWHCMADECSAPYVFVVIPLLYENKLQLQFDEVWVVTANEDERIRRVMSRDGVTREAVVRRMENQMPEVEKTGQADRVIDTTEGYEATLQATKDALSTLKEKLGIAEA
jgi:dephospho-CoA kinase